MSAAVGKAPSRARTLWVPAGNGAVPPATMLLGLPIARRIAFAAQRAGFDRVLFEDSEGPGTLHRALAGTTAEIVPAGTPSIEGAVVLPPGNLPSVPWLAARVAGAGGASAGAEGAPQSGFFPIQRTDDLPGAERWLLRGLVKDTEGFMSRHVERRISLALSRRLASTRVTPNAMTLISVAVGLAGAALFLSARASIQFGGALLFLLHSILDGCDGEIARLKFQESRGGGVLDFWGDNFVHVAVFGCLAAGWFRASGDPWLLIAGLAAILGTLLSATLVFRQTMSQSKEGSLFTTVTSGPATRASRMADALARRDFIYLVILLAAFGKAHWFLILAAIGSPLFFLALVAMEVSARRLGRSYS